MTTPNPSDNTNTKPPFLKSFLMLPLIAAFIGAFLWICNALSVTQFWVAFMFLLYWAMIEHANPRALPQCVIGSVLGLLLCFAFSALPEFMGDKGMFAFLGLIMAVIYFQLLGWFSIAINPLTMCFLTIGTIPAVQQSFYISDALFGLLLGVIYFGGIITSANYLLKRASGDADSPQ